MGGETEAAWRHVLEDLLGRGLKAPELLIVDGGKGLEAALASLWSDIPVQRCTVHKERNLLAHAPKALHDEVKADYTDMMYAENAEQVRKKRKAFLAKWRLRCRGVADSLEEAGERLFTFLRYPPQQWKSLRTDQRHRTPARGIQAPGEDPMRTTQRGNGGHAVLGLEGLGADHHAPRRWLANTRPSAGQEAD